MRAALGLGMYWLLAWCSSSLLKYWIVLFKPSSSGTCRHKTKIVRRVRQVEGVNRYQAGLGLVPSSPDEPIKKRPDIATTAITVDTEG